MISRKNFWKKENNINVLFETDYLFSTLINSNFINSLQNIALKIINKSLNKSFNDLDESLKFINQTTSIKLLKEKDLYTQLDCELYKVIKYFNFDKSIKGIEFPANLRVAHGIAPGSYMDRQYATDYFHSDIWSDEPEDMINVIIYLAGDLDATKMEIYDFNDDIAEDILNYRGDYKLAPFSRDKFKKIDYKPLIGQAIFWDGIVPHNTFRKDGLARISIDFRIRRIDPYLNIDDRWTRDYIPRSRYWYLNTKMNNEFEKRLTEEIKNISILHSNKVVQKRLNCSTKDF